ncbi:MAG: putative ABC transporter permease subunit [Chloroflexota bacterium]
MLADTWLLLTLRWQVAWNGFRSRRLPAKVGIALGTLALVVVAGGGAVSLGWGLGGLLRRFPQWQLEGVLPGLILTAISLILLVSSFGVALGSLFLANDLELLMSAPVDRRAVFVSKILDGLGWYYAIVAVTAVPALIAYGIGLHYGPLYYLLAVIAVLGAPLLPAGLGALLVMLVARFAPARRVREALGLLAALVGISCSIVGQTERLWSQQWRNANVDPQALLRDLQAFASLPIPSLVAGRGLAAAGTGNWPVALGSVAGFLLLTFGFFAGCIWLADAMYATGWVRMQSSGSARRGAARAAREAARTGWLGRAPASLAIALKDWRVIPRDLRNFAQLLSPLVVLPAVYVNLLGGGRRSFDAVAAADRWTNGAVDPRGIVVATGILTATILVFGRIASTSISREGRSWWLLKAAPMTALQVLTGKLTAAAIPFALLSTALMAGAAVWSGFSLAGTLYGWFGIHLLGTGMLALSVAWGVPWARLDWDDPRRMGSGWAALASLLSSGLLAVVAGGLLCLPVVAEAFWPAMAAPAWVFGPGAATVVTLGVIGLALQFGSNRLGDVGEA